MLPPGKADCIDIIVYFQMELTAGKFTNRLVVFQLDARVQGPCTCVTGLEGTQYNVNHIVSDCENQ